MTNLVVNGKDPLTQGDAAHRALFQQMSGCAHGFPSAAVIDVAINLLVNALRQSHGSRREVEARIDALMAHAKDKLMDHYDPVTGRRRSTLAYTQVVSVPHFIDKDR